MLSILKTLSKRNKVLIAIAVILFAVAVPLTIIQVQKQQDIRQRAAETDVSLYFANQADCNTPIENFNTFPTLLSLCLDTRGNNVNGFDITVASNLTLSLASPGADANRFDLDLSDGVEVRNYDSSLHFAKFSTSNTGINGKLSLANFTITKAADDNSDIPIIASAQITSPTNNTAYLSSNAPELSYSPPAIEVPEQPVVIPAPTKTPEEIKTCKTANCGQQWLSERIKENDGQPLNAKRQEELTFQCWIDNQCVVSTPTPIPLVAAPTATPTPIPPPATVVQPSTLCTATCTEIPEATCNNFVNRIDNSTTGLELTTLQNEITNFYISSSAAEACASEGNSLLDRARAKLNQPQGSAPGQTQPPATGDAPANQPPAAGNTILTISLNLEGISIENDANGKAKGNPNPKTKTRPTTIELLNSSNQVVATKTGQPLTFDPATGLFKGDVNLGNSIAGGNYLIKIKSDRYVKRLLPGIVTIISGQRITVPVLTLFAGDVNGDNTLDILDYNIFTSCFGAKATAVSCTKRDFADVNDDGNVDGIDYNLFVKCLAIRKGD